MKLTHLSALTHRYDVLFLPFERAERLAGAFLVVDGGRKGFERLGYFRQREREREKRNAVGFVKFRFRRDFIGEFCRKVSPQETEFVQFRTFRLNALACPVFLNLVYKLRNARASSPRSLSSRFVPRLILALCH